MDASMDNVHGRVLDVHGRVHGQDAPWTFLYPLSKKSILVKLMTMNNELFFYFIIIFVFIFYLPFG